MTTYSTTAVATTAADNTVTVASIANMFPGLPITFSGVTFGGITVGSTYYIGTITYGYPTSKITLSSLPGGATFVLTTASGSMTATWESGGQLIIETDPPGESLNSAFTKINVNFDQIQKMYFGATQKLTEIVEKQQEVISTLLDIHKRNNLM